MRWGIAHWFGFVLAWGGSTLAFSDVVPVRVTVENLAPANSVAVAPVRFGFGNGTFDAFDEGSAAFLLGYPDIAAAPIVTIAEGGSGANWFPAFSDAEPMADLGSVLGPMIAPFLPGESSSTIISVDTDNRYFTFATMVVPSNDFFLGNDAPMAYEVFDASGNLVLNTITQNAAQIWDAGSETENPNNATFLQIGMNDQREDENGVVSFNFSELDTFDGLTTAANYVFDSDLLSANTEILRVSFEVVPEPAAGLAWMGIGVGWIVMRRRLAGCA